jgi:thiol-disulfide isomerase/thioredoxin
MIAVVAAVAYQQFFAAHGERNADASAPTTAAGGALSIRRAEQPRPVPELHFVDGAAKPRSLVEFRGRVVLLNIWATWCVPCRKEMPALDRLQATLGGPGFEVVALSIDRDGVPKIKDFYEELGLKALRIYVDASGDVMAKLGAVGIPLTLLVDRQGDELWRLIGPAEWDQPAIVETIRKEIGAPTK